MSRRISHALALCLLPLLLAGRALPSLGQATSTKTSPSQSLFVQDLTRDSLGHSPDVDADAPEIARVGRDGHLIVTGGQVDVWLAPGQYAELRPNLVFPGYTPVALAVFEDGQRTQSYGLEQGGGLPLLRIEPPQGERNRKRVQVALYDASGQPRQVQQCLVRSHVAGAALAVSAQTTSTTATLTFADRPALGGISLYVNGLYLGRVRDEAKQAHLDVRGLRPGHYTARILAQNTDGVLLGAATTQIVIPARYTLDCDAPPAGPLEVHSAEDQVRATVTRGPESGIVKTRFYIAGDFVGELPGAPLTFLLPLKDVPSGPTTIDVIGIGADGAAYGVESLPLMVSNALWESHAYASPAYADIQTKQVQLESARRQFETWFEKAAHEPFSRMVGELSESFLQRDYTGQYNITRTVHQIYAPGRAVEYKRNAEKYLREMAKLRLEMGRDYASLHMRQQAKAMFQQTIHDVGEEDTLGAQAKAELEKLSNPT